MVVTARAAALLAVAVALVAASLPACRRDVAAVAPSPSVAVADPVDELAADDPVAGLATAIVDLYGHVTLGNFAAYVDTLAAELPIALIGVTADSVVVGRAPANAGRDRRVLRALQPVLLPKNLEIDLGADGSVGWVFDELSYRVTFHQRIASIPLRHTAVWVRDFDRWVEVVEHQSYAVPLAELVQQAAAGRLPPPVGFTRSPATPAASALLGRALAFLTADDPAARAALFDPRPDVVVLTPDGELRGDAARDAPALASRLGPGTRVALGDSRVAIDRSDTVAWVVANLEASTTHNERPVVLGLRASFLFARGDDGWRVVQAHLSAPITPGELGRRVFGTE